MFSKCHWEIVKVFYLAEASSPLICIVPVVLGEVNKLSNEMFPFLNIYD